jgi:hypothetical protein
VAECQHRECGWPETKQYFMEWRGPASMTIDKYWLCDKHAMELAKTEYVEEVACDCTGWEHIFGKDFDMAAGYGCPGPTQPWPNPCCGAMDDRDVSRPCVNNRCIEHFCGGCGVSTHGGSGPVGCGCDVHWFKHPNYEERRMISTPNGGEYNRRRKARVKRK